MRKKIQKVLKILQDITISFFYNSIFTLTFKGNIWNIYKSYHKEKKIWKKTIWNKYMLSHSASISIDAKFASELILPHGVSGIFISQSATLGQNVVIFQQVTIGSNTLKESKSYGAPTIGDNVYIGAGAKIIGNAVVSNNVRIGANAVVVKNVPYNSIVVIGEMHIIQKKEEFDNSFTPYI